MRGGNCSIVNPRSNIEKSIIRFGKLFLIFGGWYFFIRLLKIIMLNDVDKTIELWNLIHHTLVESPGGAQWYTYSCIMMLLILWICCRKKNYHITLFIVFFLTYLFGSVFMLDIFKQFPPRVWYDKLLCSDRNILHFGVYFMLGYVISIENKTLEYRKLVQAFVYIELFVYIFFGLFLYKRTSVAMTLIFSLLKLMGVYCLFELSLHIKSIAFDTVLLRKMSTVIYFTHYTLVYVFVAMSSILNNNIIASLLCTLCSVVIAYIIVNGWDGKIYKVLFLRG